VEERILEREGEPGGYDCGGPLDGMNARVLAELAATFPRYSDPASGDADLFALLLARVMSIPVCSSAAQVRRRALRWLPHVIARYSDPARR
jgi:hypothetical protein